MHHPFRPIRFLVVFVFLLLFPTHLSAFSFSEYEAEEKAADAQAQQAAPIADLRCPDSIKNSRVATMIGERHRDDRRAYWGFRGVFLNSPDQVWDDRFGTTKSVYGSLVESLNSGFSQLGLKTYTAKQIEDQIAQEEQEAVLNDDIDAALSAAERLKADYMLKGIISSLSQTNKVVKVDEAFITIELALIDREGRQISRVSIKETVFSDADIPATIRELVRKNANYISYTLFKDICSGGN